MKWHTKILMQANFIFSLWIMDERKLSKNGRKTRENNKSSRQCAAHAFESLKLVTVPFIRIPREKNDSGQEERERDLSWGRIMKRRKKVSFQNGSIQNMRLKLCLLKNVNESDFYDQNYTYLQINVMCLYS